MTKEQILAAYAKIARPVMRQFMEAESCVTATRVTCEFFDGCHMPSVPVPCKLMFKVPGKNYMYVSGWKGKIKERMKHEAKAWHDVAPVGPTWAGHLLALVQDRWLVDASIDQVTSPEHGVTVPPIALVVDLGTQGATALTGTVSAAVVLDDGASAEITYISTDDHKYAKTEAWLDGTGARVIAVMIAREISAEIDA
jgi:hypothetical protein